jgi:hypothetical protein
MLWINPCRAAQLDGRGFCRPTRQHLLERSTNVLSAQWGSNRVSGACLPKTGIFAVVAGDFCRNGLRVRHFRSSETGAESQKRANGGLFRSLTGGTSGLRNAWLATQC